MCCFATILLTALAFGVLPSSYASGEQCTSISTTPSGRCGLRGQLRKRSPSFTLSEPSIVSSVEECAYLCSRRVVSHELRQGNNNYRSSYGYCNSFQFNEDDNTCVLIESPVRATAKANSTSPNLYYSYECFDCGDITNQPYGEQLLDNPSFEGELLGPWAVDSGSLSTPGHSSLQTFACSNQYRCTLNQNFNHLAGEMYAARFFLKDASNTTNHGGTFEADLASFSSPYGSKRDTPTTRVTYSGTRYNYDFYQSSGSQSWKEIWIFNPTPISGRQRQYGINFFLDELGSGSNIQIDDLLVFRMPTNPSTKPGAKSVLKNGGFETGTAGPWYFGSAGYGYGKIVSPGINSHYALQLGGKDSVEGFISQGVTTNPGTAYLLSFDMSLTMAGRYLNQRIEFGDDLESVQNELYYYPEGEYNTTFTLPFVARETSTPITFIHDFFNLQGNHSKYTSKLLLDNFSLIELADSLTSMVG